MERPFGSRLADEIAEAAHEHHLDDPAYIARIRRAARRLGVSDDAPDDAHGALLAIEEAARIDVDVPTISRRKDAALVKLAVKRLTGWYLGYLGDQITRLGQATTRFGTAMMSRTDRLEETAATLRDDIVALKTRVERLEHGASSE